MEWLPVLVQAMDNAKVELVVGQGAILAAQCQAVVAS